MVLSSLTFLYLFLPAVVLLYYLSPMRAKNGVLLAGSLLFYAWGDPQNLLLILLMAYIAYITGMQTGQPSNTQKTKKRIFLIGLCINLLLLLVFKYSGDIFAGLIVFGAVVPFRLDIPIGMSFFTLRLILYEREVYQGLAPAQTSFPRFLMAVTLFPLMNAGPLLPVRDMRPGLAARERPVTNRDILSGMALFVVGLSKKVLLADETGLLWKTVKATPLQQLPVMMSWAGVLAGVFLLYFEFTSYRDMAAGLCRLFGFRIPVRGGGLFCAMSVRSFLRAVNAYVYDYFSQLFRKPGSGPVPVWKLLIGTLLASLSAGALFGLKVNYLIFGLYIGLVLFAERLLQPRLDKLPQLIRFVLLMPTVAVGVVLLSFYSFPDALAFLRVMAGMGSAVFFDEYTLKLLTDSLPVFLFCALTASRGARFLLRLVRRRYPRAANAIGGAACICLLVLSTIYLVEAGSSPFLFLRM